MISRRSVLQTTALAVPAVLSAQSPNDTVRVAFIGVGNRGGYLLTHMIKVPGVQVVAISDLDAERLAKAVEVVGAGGGKAEGFEDYRKMLDARKDIDAVVIATPVDTHKGIAIAALEAGKHVYCEKPMSTNAADTAVMVLAAKNAKGIFQAGFQLRHDPNRHASMEFVRGGGIGRVLFLQAFRHGGDLPHNAAWLFDRKRSGDIIVEQACHILDLMTWAAGKPPLRAYGAGGINLFQDDPPGRTVMDNYAVIYEYPGDIRLSFSQIYFDPPQFSGIKERVFGSVGAIDLAAATWSERKNKGEIKLDVPNAGQSADYMSLAAFIENARSGKTPLNNAESAAQSTLVAILGRKAIEEHRVVTWDEVTS